jgi:hypothetical protein
MQCWRRDKADSVGHTKSASSVIQSICTTTELPWHAVLLAEGLAAGSYLDTGDRSDFVNGDGPIALYPDFSSRIWEAEGCAALIVTGPALDGSRQWVNVLASASEANAPEKVLSDQWSGRTTA